MERSREYRGTVIATETAEMRSAGNLCGGQRPANHFTGRGFYIRTSGFDHVEYSFFGMDNSLQSPKAKSKMQPRGERGGIPPFER
jgi:hypothetical protein